MILQLLLVGHVLDSVDRDLPVCDRVELQSGSAVPKWYLVRSL